MVSLAFAHVRQGSDLCPNVGLEVQSFHRQMKARHTIHAIAIKQCHRGHLMSPAHFRQFLWNRGTFEEAERRAGMEFDVHRSVVACVHKPLSAHKVPINAIQRHASTVSRGERHVPLFAVQGPPFLSPFSSGMFSVHQSPDERHGPADHKILPCTPLRSVCFATVVKLTGRPSDSRTRSSHGGRNIRNTSRGLLSLSDNVGRLTRLDSSGAATNRSIRKLPC